MALGELEYAVWFDTIYNRLDIRIFQLRHLRDSNMKRVRAYLIPGYATCSTSCQGGTDPEFGERLYFPVIPAFAQICVNYYLCRGN